MNHAIYSKLTTLCFVLVPTVSACALTDVAGNVDAGASAGQPGTGGTQSYDYSTGGQLSTGGAVADTGGAAAGIGGAATDVGGSSAGGSTADVNVQTGGACSGTAPTPIPTWALADGCVTGNESTQFFGTWEGNVQGAAIGDEASTIRLTILGANSKGLCGTVTFGIHTAPVTLPAVTDPLAAYPPASIAPSYYYGEAPSTPILGVAYTMQDGTFLGQRATFHVDGAEVMLEWCSLQTAYPINGCSEFGCDPLGAITAGTDWRRSVCKGPICECNVDHCSASHSYSNLFDLTFSNDQALGTLNAQKVVTFNRVGCAKSGETCETNSDCCGQLCAATNADGGTVCK